MSDKVEYVECSAYAVGEGVKPIDPCEDFYNPQSQTITWIASLEPGEEKEFKFKVRVKQGAAGQVKNTAFVPMNPKDPEASTHRTSSCLRSAK